MGNPGAAAGSCRRFAATAGEVFKIKEYPLGARPCAPPFLYAVSVMTPSHSSVPSAAAPRQGPRSWRTVLTIAAVACAALGLASLVAVLLSAWLQGAVWPGFVAASYVFLPLGFLLMCSLVIGAVINRRRS